MRMSIGIGDAAMGGPAGVANGDAGYGIEGERGWNLPRVLDRGEAVCFTPDNAPRVVAAIFEALESRTNGKRHISLKSDISKDSAHVMFALSLGHTRFQQRNSTTVADWQCGSNERCFPENRPCASTLDFPAREERGGVAAWLPW